MVEKKSQESLRERASARDHALYRQGWTDRQSLGMARLVSAAARSLASLRGNVSISSPTLSLSLPLALPFLPSPSSDRARHSRTRMERPPAGRPRSLTHPGWQAEARGGRTNERPSERVSKPLSSFPSDDRPTTQPFLAASPHWPEAREGERAGLVVHLHALGLALPARGVHLEHVVHLFW